MAGEEDQPENVVLDEVDRRAEFGHAVLLTEAVTNLGSPATQGLRAAERVDGAALGGRHQPRTWIGWYAVARPLLERGEQCVLSKILGQVEVPGHPGESTDQPGGFRTPRRGDRGNGRGRAHV